MGFRISEWVSGVSDWISGFQIESLDYRLDFWAADSVWDFFRDGPLGREFSSIAPTPTFRVWLPKNAHLYLLIYSLECSCVPDSGDPTGPHWPQDTRHPSQHKQLHGKFVLQRLNVRWLDNYITRFQTVESSLSLATAILDFRQWY